MNESISRRMSRWRRSARKHWKHSRCFSTRWSPTSFGNMSRNTSKCFSIRLRDIHWSRSVVLSACCWTSPLWMRMPISSRNIYRRCCLSWSRSSIIIWKNSRRNRYRHALQRCCNSLENFLRRRWQRLYPIDVGHWRIIVVASRRNKPTLRLPRWIHRFPMRLRIFFLTWFVK